MLAQLSMLCLFFTEWPAPTTPALRHDLVGNKGRPRGTCVGAMRVEPPTQGVTWIFLSVYFFPSVLDRGPWTAPLHALIYSFCFSNKC